MDARNSILLNLGSESRVFEERSIRAQQKGVARGGGSRRRAYVDVTGQPFHGRVSDASPTLFL
jgi:hypothetical protein